MILLRMNRYFCYSFAGTEVYPAFYDTVFTVVMFCLGFRGLFLLSVMMWLLMPEVDVVFGEQDVFFVEHVGSWNGRWVECCVGDTIF